MSVEELQTRLDAILKGLPVSGFDATSDSVIADLAACIAQAEGMGMKTGKEVIENLTNSLKTRKTGGNTDDSVLVRLTALEFYVQKMKDGTAEES
jgi:hypothetical protein